MFEPYVVKELRQLGQVLELVVLRQEVRQVGLLVHLVTLSIPLVVLV